MRKTLLLTVPAVLLSACTWGITLDDAARGVRTAWEGDVSGCHDVSKITVSVQDHVGPVNRNDIKVRDELEVLARNEAAKAHADTVKPLGDPDDGSQSWEAYVCGPRGAGPSRAPASAPAGQNQGGGFQDVGGGAQTYPVKGG
jgi:hypothetical protein